MLPLLHIAVSFDARAARIQDLPRHKTAYCFSQTDVRKGSPGEFPVSVIVWPSGATS
jgi:hypothetical protein